jgi:hypothetical protein
MQVVSVLQDQQVLLARVEREANASREREQAALRLIGSLKEEVATIKDVLIRLLSDPDRNPASSGPLSARSGASFRPAPQAEEPRRATQGFFARTPSAPVAAAAEAALRAAAEAAEAQKAKDAAAAPVQNQTGGRSAERDQRSEARTVEPTESTDKVSEDVARQNGGTQSSEEQMRAGSEDGCEAREELREKDSNGLGGDQESFEETEHGWGGIEEECEGRSGRGPGGRENPLEESGVEGGLSGGGSPPEASVDGTSGAQRKERRSRQQAANKRDEEGGACAMEREMFRGESRDVDVGLPSRSQGHVPQSGAEKNKPANGRGDKPMEDADGNGQDPEAVPEWAMEYCRQAIQIGCRVLARMGVRKVGKPVVFKRD